MCGKNHQGIQGRIYGKAKRTRCQCSSFLALLLPLQSYYHSPHPFHRRLIGEIKINGELHTVGKHGQLHDRVLYSQALFKVLVCEIFLLPELLIRLGSIVGRSSRIFIQASQIIRCCEG